MTYDPREHQVSSTDDAAGGLIWLAMIAAMILFGDDLPSQRAIMPPELHGIAGPEGPRVTSGDAVGRGKAHRLTNLLLAEVGGFWRERPSHCRAGAAKPPPT